jgi:hypothetical protein
VKVAFSDPDLIISTDLGNALLAKINGPVVDGPLWAVVVSRYDDSAAGETCVAGAFVTNEDDARAVAECLSHRHICPDCTHGVA